MAATADDKPLATIQCPACGKSVRLPATTCPFCKADLRTGERPEEKVSVWQRRGLKTIVVILLLLLPVGAYVIANYDSIDWGSEGGLKDRLLLRLHSCADPQPKMWEEDDQEAQKKAVKAGYSSWKDNKRQRAMGQGQYDPDAEGMSEEELEARTDRRGYFATTLLADGPSKSLDPGDNWYGDLAGEWDVAYITGFGTPEENIVNGEWNFVWINGGDAMEDVLNVPYLWDMSKAEAPIRMTTIRTYNGTEKLWEGARVMPGRIAPFRAVRNQDGSIIENFVSPRGSHEFWVYANITKDSFQVYISETKDNGQSYDTIAEIWAKGRAIERM
ncbi:MAG: zinc ribbon domain-containing protein [Deltaproteobacteria bacterium]|nr:zinc ribbon domain-containing protein [Deltaproteobacteria bacterium]